MTKPYGDAPDISPDGTNITCPGCRNIVPVVPARDGAPKHRAIAYHTLKEDCPAGSRLLAELWPASDEYLVPVVDATRAELLSNVSVLLANVGERMKCVFCHEEIWMVTHRSGKRAPYDRKGANHLSKCKAPI